MRRENYERIKQMLKEEDASDILWVMLKDIGDATFVAEELVQILREVDLEPFADPNIEEDEDEEEDLPDDDDDDDDGAV